VLAGHVTAAVIKSLATNALATKNVRFDLIAKYRPPTVGPMDDTRALFENPRELYLAHISTVKSPVPKLTEVPDGTLKKSPLPSNMAAPVPKYGEPVLTFASPLAVTVKAFGPLSTKFVDAFEPSMCSRSDV
jgi:hypothetical protein